MGRRRIVTARGPRDGMGTTRVVLSRKLQLDRVQLAYGEAGVGPPIMLLHGLGGSSRWWFRLYPELTAANFRVLTPDLPGFGRSPGPLLEPDQAARTVVRFATHLGLTQFFLVGHSMGGAIAVQVAAEFPDRVRRLALIDTAGIPGTGPLRVLGRLAQPWSWCPWGFMKAFLSDVLLRAGPATMLAGIRQLRHNDIRPLLDRIEIPTLVIWGERDGLTPPEHGKRVAERLSNARLEVVSGARHLPMISHPQATARLLSGFFKEELSRRGASTL